MYADPKRIRKHVLKVCLDDYEAKVIDQIVAQTGQQRQVVLRELLLEGLERLAKSEEPTPQ
ncbi:MAG: hypothetical protein RLZZ460_665 [Chloroflexota bacterium]|jgi:hypothetical protein